MFFYSATPPAPVSSQQPLAASGPAKPKGKDAKSAQGSSAPKAVPGRRKRSSMSASSSSPTSPKSTSSSTPLSPVPSPLASTPGSSSANDANRFTPKVVKAGKQGKALKGEAFVPPSAPVECKVTASNEKPLEAYPKQTVVEAKTAPIEPNKPSLAATKPVAAPAAFKVTSKPAVAAPVSFSGTLASSPTKSVEVKTASSKAAPFPSPADDDLPPLIPPEKPIKMPVFVPPVEKEGAKLATTPPKPCSEPPNVQNYDFAPVEITRIASEPKTDIGPKSVPAEFVKAAAMVESAPVEGAKLVAEASTAGVKVAKPTPTESPKPVAEARPAPIEVAMPAAEAKPAPVESVKPDEEVKSAPVVVIKPVAEPEPGAAEVTSLTPGKGVEPVTEADLAEVKSVPAEVAKLSPVSLKPTPVEPAVPAPAPRKLTFAEAVAKPAPVKPEVEVVSTTPSEPVSSLNPAPTPAKTPAKVEPVIKNDKGIFFYLFFCLHLYFQLLQCSGNRSINLDIWICCSKANVMKYISFALNSKLFQDAT